MYVFPGPKDRIAADLGLFADDVSRIADASSTITAGKLSISDEWEVGLAADLGLLRDHAGTLSSVQVGTKLGLDEHMALTGAAVLPLGETDDLGLSVGLMKTFLAGQHMVNTWTSAALLDGYTGKGVALSVLIEPTRSVGDRITGYLDVNVRSNTEARETNWASTSGRMWTSTGIKQRPSTPASVSVWQVMRNRTISRSH